MRSSTGPTEVALTLAQLTGSADFFPGVANVVQEIPLASNAAEAVELLREAGCRMGAMSCAFVSFVRDDDSMESFRFLLACDPVMCVEYEKLGWYGDDPWLRYAAGHTEPVTDRGIPLQSEQDRRIASLTHRCGFASALVVPAPAGPGLTRLGVLCLGSSTCGFFEADGIVPLRIAARSLAMELHEWWIRQIKYDMVSAARLTPDDLVLLAHEWKGHSTKRIAQTLGATPGSIDSRFQRLNAKLGVPSRKAAARLAAEYGLL